jgi:hypothetical protein
MPGADLPALGRRPRLREFRRQPGIGEQGHRRGPGTGRGIIEPTDLAVRDVAGGIADGAGVEVMSP